MAHEHGDQHPVSHHLRVSHMTGANGDDNIRYLIVQPGAPVDRIITHQVSKGAIDACERQLGNAATDLGDYVDSMNSPQPAARTRRFTFAELGEALAACLPPGLVTDVLGASTGPLTITTDRPAFPWHLVAVHGTFLGVFRPVTLRLALNTMDVQPTAQFNQSEPLRALLIGNPTADRAETEREIEFVSAELTRALPGIEIVPLLQSRANRDAVRLHLSQPNYHYIHYAGHARFEHAHGGKRGFALADGHFSLHDIRTYQRAHPFVFLNACHGGAVTTTLRNNSLGFSYVTGKLDGFGIEFLRTGARAFIAPLWPVYDGYAHIFAKRFYTIALTGVTLGEALQQARAAALRERPQDPTWATYVLYADSDETLVERTVRSARGNPDQRQPVASKSPAAEPPQPRAKEAQAAQAAQAAGALRGADPDAERHARKLAQRFMQVSLEDSSIAAAAGASLDAAWVFWQVRADIDVHHRRDLHALDLFIALCERADDPALAAILQHFFQSATLQQRARQEFGFDDDDMDVDHHRGIGITDKFAEAVRASAAHAHQAGRDELRALDLALALLTSPVGSVQRGIRACRADADAARAALEALERSRVAPSAPSAPTPHAANQTYVSIDQDISGSVQPHQGDDLLDQARHQQLTYTWGWSERSIGGPLPTSAGFARWNERVLTLANALQRDDSAAPHHVALVGPYGVGAWGVIHALALALATPPVDQPFSPLAGAMFRGLRLPPDAKLDVNVACQQLKSFLAEANLAASLAGSSLLLLAIDGLARALTRAEDADELGAILGHALSQPRIRIICAERDAAALPSAMAQRFTTQNVPPLAPNDTRELLAGYEGWLQHEEPYPTCEPEALSAAAQATLPTMAQPGLGITLVDTAMRQVRADARKEERARTGTLIIDFDPPSHPTIGSGEPTHAVVTAAHIAATLDALRNGKR